MGVSHAAKHGLEQFFRVSGMSYILVLVSFSSISLETDNELILIKKFRFYKEIMAYMFKIKVATTTFGNFTTISAAPTPAE